MSNRALYGPGHRPLRRALAPQVPGMACWRCGLPILAGQPWDLGHDDDNPARYRGPEHARCSRQAGARKGNQRRRQRRERMVAMVTELVLGIEVSEDRQHCSVAAAGPLEHGLVLLDLAAYLDGTDPLAEVLDIRTRRKVLAVVVDPHSHAATCIRPLEASKVPVTKPTSADLVVAHGEFLDALAAGRVRHQGQAELTAAARHLQQRRLGGATAPERRGAPVDVSPAVAAELALWGLQTVKRRPRPMLVVSNP